MHDGMRLIIKLMTLSMAAPAETKEESREEFKKPIMATGAPSPQTPAQLKTLIEKLASEYDSLKHYNLGVD